MERTNPVHYLIRFLVFMMALMLVIALIIAVSGQKPSSESQGTSPEIEWVRYEVSPH